MYEKPESYSLEQFSALASKAAVPHIFTPQPSFQVKEIGSVWQITKQHY